MHRPSTASRVGGCGFCNEILSLDRDGLRPCVQRIQVCDPGADPGSRCVLAPLKAILRERTPYHTALELGVHGITVNAYAPGAIDTDMRMSLYQLAYQIFFPVLRDSESRRRRRHHLRRHRHAGTNHSPSYIPDALPSSPLGSQYSAASPLGCIGCDSFSCSRLIIIFILE